MPYQSPINGLTSGLLAGSQLALQYRQVKDQEEQTKRKNELAAVEQALELYKVAKSPEAKKFASQNLSTAMKNAGYMAPDMTFVDDGSPEAKNFVQTAHDAMNMFNKGMIDENKVQDLILNSLKSGMENADPIAMKTNPDTLMKETKGQMAQSLLRNPENPASLTTSQGSLLSLPGTDAAYNTPEAKAGIMDYAQPTIGRAAALDAGATEKYLADVEKGKPKETTGTWHTTDYVVGKEPVLLNSGTSKYKVGNQEFDALPSDAKRSGEQYKKGRPVGRGWVTKQQIISDPQTGELRYAKTGEPASEEDTAQMRPLTIKAPPTADLKELADIKSTYSRLDDVLAKAEKMKDKFGPVSGRWNKLKVKFQNEGPTQSVINELKSTITIAYGLSGKQISYQEMQMLQEAFLPALEQPYENFQATANFAKTLLGSIHDNRISEYENSGYDVNSKKLLGGSEPASKAAATKPRKAAVPATKQKVGRFTVEVEE
jgi:hypothetical protein